jgi:type I restriction enzyme R subunit
MKLQPITETGTGQVQNQHETLLDAIIAKLNYLYEGQLTDSDKLVYVNNVLKGQLLESELLQQQAASNSKEQFANSAELHSELTKAIINALDAHPAMGSQALNNSALQLGFYGLTAEPGGAVGGAQGEGSRRG